MVSLLTDKNCVMHIQLLGHYVRNISDAVSKILEKMFKNHVFRLRGEEWITDCLDMNVQAIDVDPI